jgi:UDPglucose 6-dehydrogenase
MAEQIAVVGCGHVGLVMAAGLAALGHDVYGIDIDQALVERLTAGTVELHEPGLEELVREGAAAGRLAFTTDYGLVIGRVGFIFLAVDTPQTTAGAADLRALRSAVGSIAQHLDGTAPIIVNKSTSPIGTGETIEGIVDAALEKSRRRPRVASNPEFLRQGHSVEDFWAPTRIVVGARAPSDAAAVARLYDPLVAKLPAERQPAVILTDLRTAEMTKYVANAILATRVSFINEIARLCDALGTDVDTVIAGVAPDPRIGAGFLSPGIGYGGSCLPKDVAALRYVGEAVGVATPVLSAVQEVNAIAKTSVVRRLRSYLGGLEGKRLGVWGLTFKGGTEDTRQSPAMEVVAMLRNEGAVVHAYDPAVPAAGQLPMSYWSVVRFSALEAATDADALLILTDWPEFAAEDLAAVAEVMAGDVLFDGRNLLDRAAVEAAGLAYLGVGRVGSAPRRRRTDR